MDDVFDLSKTAQDTEIELANADWRKQMGSVTLDAEREGLYDGFENKVQNHFDRGLNVGFEAVKELALFKGRLMKLQSLRGSDEHAANELIEEIKTTEAEVIRCLASRGQVPENASVDLDNSDLKQKIQLLKDKVREKISTSV